jgi:membrane protease YdiL (CAAX protease family)
MAPKAMSPDLIDACPAPPQRNRGEIIRRVLEVLGACLLLLVFLEVANRVTDDRLYGSVITVVPALGLQAIAHWKGWRASLPVPGFSRLRLLSLAAPLLFVVGNFCGHPISASISLEVWIAVVLLCLVVGFGEELFFRGFLFALLRDARPTVCLLVTSLIFGLFHFGQGMRGIVYGGIIGLSFGLARLAGMPLTLLMLVHALINLPVQLPQVVGLPTDKIVINALAFKINTHSRFLLFVFALVYSIVITAVFITSYHSILQRARVWAGERLRRRPE